MIEKTAKVKASLVVAVLVPLLALGTACSASDTSGTGTPVSTGGTLPPPGDAFCDDPVGDLADDSRVEGTLSDPPGVDLVRAESKLGAQTLKVTFTTNGAINQTREPTFIVATGTPASDTSFEIRATPKGPAPSPAWGLELITFKAGNEAPRKPLAAPVTVDDRTLSFEIPLTDLPPVVTLIWQYGSSSGDGDAALTDDCNNISPAGPTGSAPRGTTSSTAPPTTLAPIPLGTEQTYPATGSKVTVFAAQFPVASPKPLPEGIEMAGGGAAGAVDLQVCAGDKQTEARAEFVQVKMSDNRIYPLWPVPYSAVDPAFPRTTALSPGPSACVRGWVTFALPNDVTISSVYYSPDTSGRNFLTWNVS